MEHAPVLIIGGGPVGLATALDLALRGVKSIVVEREKTTGQEILAKASMLNERSMEICRWWGIRDLVADCGVPDNANMDTIYCTALNGSLIGVDEGPSARDRVASEGAIEKLRKVPQYAFDRILADTVAEHDNVRIMYGHRCEGVDQDDDGVTTHIVDSETGERSELRGQYLVACDGAGSTVRKQMGLAFEGPVLSHSVSAMIRADMAGTKFGLRNRYMFIDETGTWSNLTAINLTDLWRFTLVGGEEKLDRMKQDILQDMKRAFGPELEFELLNVSHWRRSQCIIEKYRAGRVLFGGDSAHTTSPTGGHGLNTGIGDALALGWMLHAVISGYAGTELLDAYEAERRPIGIRNSAFSTQNFKSWISGPDFSGVLADSEEGEQIRRAVGEAMSAMLQGEWHSHGVALGYRYENSPLVESDHTPEPPDEAEFYTPTTRPGHRAPHVRLPDGRSTIDLFGKEFTLLRFPSAPDTSAIEDAARNLKVPLSVVDIHDEEAARVYKRALVLVRPDGHVAWRSNGAAENPTALIAKVAGVSHHRSPLPTM